MTLTDSAVLDRMLSMELTRVTERAAVAAAGWRGRGDERAADQSAVAAMHAELARLSISGRIVIGDGEEGEAPLLYVGEAIGVGDGPVVDIALDALEGTTICAKNLPNALSVLAVAARGALLAVPNVYMEKIAIGPGYPEGTIELDAPPAENIARLAKAKGVKPADIVTCVLDRPRHGRLIEAVRATGAAIRLIGDGDVSAILSTADPEETGIDMYLGSGGAPEGVLAAAALRCMNGQMQGRLMLDSADTVARAERAGISDPRRVFSISDMASGDVLFAATGVTDGNLLPGVKFRSGYIETTTTVMRSSSRTVRRIVARHHDAGKFE